MMDQAPIQLPVNGGGDTDQAWVSFFDSIGRALEGVWADISDSSPSLSGATATSIDTECIVQGRMGWLFLDLDGFSGGGTYDAPCTFSGTFSQIRDKGSGALTSLEVSGSTINLPASAGDYQVQVYAPVILDNKLARR